MKRISLFLVMVVMFSVQINAELPHHTNILTVEYGGVWQNDEYLSPLLYSGQMIGIQNEWHTTFRCDSTWRHRGRVHLIGAMTDNNRGVVNSQQAFGGEAAWGATWHVQQANLLPALLKDLDVFVGSELNIHYMGRNIASYANKPFNMDAGLTLQLCAGISYTFRAPKTAYRLEYTLNTDLMGAMFVPDYWPSYYEMPQIWQDAVVFASFHNRQTLSHQLMIDMQFKRSTWRVGIRHHYQQYTAHNLHFSREEVCVVVGTLFNYHVRHTDL